MSSEESKGAALRWVAAVNSGDEDAILASLHKDFKFRCMACAPEALKVEINREQTAKVPQALSAGLKKPFKFMVVRAIAEDDKVAIEMQGDCEMRNGQRYDNRYHFGFDIKDGLVIELREYSCTYTAYNLWKGSQELAATGVLDPSA